MEKQFIKRSCDSPVCDTVEIVDQQNPNIPQLARWVNLVTFVIENGQQGPQLKPVVKQACRVQCAMNILKTLATVPQDRKPEEKPDLEKLRAAASEPVKDVPPPPPPVSVPADQEPL